MAKHPRVFCTYEEKKTKDERIEDETVFYMADSTVVAGLHSAKFHHTERLPLGRTT